MSFSFFGAHGRAAAHAKAANTARDALAEAKVAKAAVADLTAQVDRLQMICEALWTTMKERLGTTDQQLADLIEQIDLRDGAVNGRTVSPPRECARCRRVLAARTGTCIYCGAIDMRPAIF